MTSPLTCISFPHYLYHREAVCFACSTPLTNLSPTQHAPGNGHYRGQCPKCDMLSWYDCAEGSVELVDTNEAHKVTR